MRVSLALVLITLVCAPIRARACDPVDALAYVARAGDGFAFVSRDAMVRVSASGEVLHRRQLSDDSGTVVMLSDGRTLLHVRYDGNAGDCRPGILRFELVDTTSDAAPRALGSFDGEGRGVEVDRFAWHDDGSITVGFTAYDASEDVTSYGAVRVRPASTALGRIALRPRPARRTEPALTSVGLRTRGAERSDGTYATELVDDAGTARVTVTTREWSPGYAISADGRAFAIATWSERGAHGTGWDARLELIDLATGTRRTAVGRGTGITSIQGTAQVTCEERAHDERSPLNVRAQPRARAAISGTILHGTVVHAAEQEGRWRRVTAPVAGWAYAASIRRACTVAP